MKVTLAKVGRKYNLGNYQSIDLFLEAVVEKGDDPQKVLEALEKQIHDYYTGRTPQLATA